MPPRIPFVIGILALCFLGYTYARASTRVQLPVPTSETIPYVAEVMGATSYEESIEESSGEVKRVQRKLTAPEHKDTDLDPEDQYAEYQGVIGRPGVDFPVLPSIPRTDFNCRKVKSSGYYADLETGCQVFHICDGGRKISFLCPNGTIFRQSHLICDWWFRVDCEKSVEQYEESAEQLAHDQMIYKKRAEEIAKAMNSKAVTEGPKTTTSSAYDQQRRRPRPQQQRLVQQQQRFQKQQQVQQQEQYTQQHEFQEQQQSQQPVLEEHERQVPAETASFASNRHRFGNQLENQYRQFLATSSTTPPPYRSQQKTFDVNTQEYTDTQDSVQNNDFNSQKTYENSENTNNNNNYQNYRTGNFGSTTQNSNYPSTNSNYQAATTNRNYPSSTSSANNNYNNFASSDNTYSNNQNNNNNENSKTHESVINTNNYSTNPAVNAYTSNGNNNYPNRGSATYFNTNKDIFPSGVYSSYNYTNTETKTQKYVQYSKSESRAQSDQVQPNKNDFVPVASTTVRSVTNKIVPYNDHTPRYEKYTSSATKQKPIFNVKIKPAKDLTYLELLRQEEKNKNVQRATSEKPAYKPPSTYDNIPVSELVTTIAPITIAQATSKNTYLPQYTPSSSVEDKVSTATNRYASINVSGTAEEIRPEVVNALMETGVTPTSVKALHSLASYISSGAAEEDYANVFNDGSQPHVSDVILNFHSGSPVTEVGLNEATTNIPFTASGEALPSVLTKATKESYSYLFSDSQEQTDLRIEEPKGNLDVDITTRRPQTTQSSVSPPNKGNNNKQDKDLKLKDSSELRELAQVFSRALSAYLEDPETFKEILAQVRPTEPNVDNTTPSVEDEVLDFSDAMLGRLGTTMPPVTTFGNSDYIDDNINIGEINSLASASKTFEPDNSLEHNTFPPTAPEALQVSQSTSPKLLLFNPKNASTVNQQIEYYSKLGSAEDQSYFPTQGGVSDTSRPRYGGFQNNTNRTPKPYSPYGSDVPKNITGLPISSPSPTATPRYNKNFNSSSQIPEPHDVNSLIKSSILNADHSGSEELFGNYQTSPSLLQEDTFYPTGDQEKVLITSGSQSLVSSNNYVQFAKKFNEQQQVGGKKQQERFLKANMNTASSTSLKQQKQEDLSSYFGQEPPRENLSQPSGFKSQSSLSSNKQTSRNKPSNKSTYKNSDPINYHIGNTNDKLVTLPPLFVSSSDYDVSYSDLGSSIGSSPSASYEQSSWTVSPLYDVTSSGSSLQFNYTQKPVPSSTHDASTKQHPTTYHPPHSSESLVIDRNQWDTTIHIENSPSEDTTPVYNLNESATTLSSDEEYEEFEKAAKEMFGKLNETAATMLMDMMAKGENNMTIRRLVLLLVKDMKENITAQESRDSLLNALLTNAEKTTIPVSSTTPTPRKKVRVSRIRVTTPTSDKNEQSKGKSYRATDSMTAVLGSVQSPAELNKINSAKLYIPSPSSEALTSSNKQLPLDSDARAVELLKTLYSLAAKWG